MPSRAQRRRRARRKRRMHAGQLTAPPIPPPLAKCEMGSLIEFHATRRPFKAMVPIYQKLTDVVASLTTLI